jgi:Zn-dependent M16 (insulinase) family peptidase
VDASAELVAAHLLSTGALWEQIRMQGGAYGAFAHQDPLEAIFTLSTYRDPSPLRSLAAFGEALRDAAAPAAPLPEDDLVKAIIGVYGKKTAPRAPSSDALVAFYRFLCGVEDQHRQARLAAVVGLSSEHLAAAFSRLASTAASGASTPGRPVIIAGPKAAAEAARELGVAVQELP